MRKIVSLLAIAAAGAVLAGCGNSGGSPSNSSAESSSTSSSTSSTSSTASSSEEEVSSAPNEFLAAFETPAGDKPDFSSVEITSFSGVDKAEDAAEGNWVMMTCKGYVYFAEPKGVYLDNVKDKDSFDDGELTFKNAPSDNDYVYKKYKVGDSFGGLKITEAETTFSAELSGEKPKYFNGGRATLEGELVLTGKCSIAREDEGYIIARDISFIPDENSCKLPIMSYNSVENGTLLTTGMAGDLVWLSEYSQIPLGNADDYDDIDFSGFPTNGDLVDAKVTITKFTIYSEKMFLSGSSAVVSNIELI